MCLTLLCYFLKDIGDKDGKYYAINVPLKDGIDDASFTRLFKTVSRWVRLYVVFMEANF